MTIPSPLIYLRQGLKYGRRILKAKLTGFKRFEGDASAICRQVLRNCWNGRYFTASLGHFREFWLRDFAISVEGLIEAGFKQEVVKTLEYALDKYRRAGKLTTTITDYGLAYDFPTYSPDSLPLLLRAIRISGSRKLLDSYKTFLVKQVEQYFMNVVDARTGLVRQDREFSSMRDLAKRRSSCYDNSMLLLLMRELSALGLQGSQEAGHTLERVIAEFWNGEYFYDDLTKSRRLSGDANIFPFWAGGINSRDMLIKALDSIREAGLDSPFPLKYSPSRRDSPKMHWGDIIAPGYEADAIWTNIGLIYIDVVSRVDLGRARIHLGQYKGLIEGYGTLLEAFSPNGKPFSTPLYKSDEGMLWCAMYLLLERKIAKTSPK